MTDALMQTLTDYGALGVFAAFLIWQFTGMQKRLDDLTERFQEQLAQINADYDERIEKMRIRYDSVIDKYDTERRTLAESLTRSVEDNNVKLDQALDKLNEGLTEMRQHYQEMRIRAASGNPE
jgi:F0F1-type ATP synthase membrane subunit b/b'